MLILTIIISSIVALAIVFSALIWFSNPDMITRPVTISAGAPLPAASSWFNNLNGRAVYKTNIDTDVVGTHEVIIRAAWKNFTGVLHIIDDVPPVAAPVSVTAIIDSVLFPEDFFDNLFDHSDVKAKFIEEPDVTETGVYDVVIKLTDEYGNYSLIESSCEIYDVKGEVFFVKGGNKKFDIRAFTSLENIDDCLFIKSPPDDFAENVGKYDVKLLINALEYDSIVTVVENSPPKIKQEDYWIFLGEKTESDNFYSFDEDMEYSLSSEFVTEPNWSLVGKQTVTIRVVDEIGHYITITPVMTVIHDTVAPVITGAVNIYTNIGATVRYRAGVTVTDDHDPDPKLKIDSSSVNIHVAGEYTVTYTATDRSGNSTSVTVEVYVSEITQEVLNQMADEKLRELGVFNTTDPVEQIWLIHRYILNNMRFLRNLVYPDNDVVMLYTGMMSMQGDCTINQRLSALFFDRIGIEHMRIINIWDRHEWNLVKLNGLWYHYDSTQYYDGVTDTYLFTNARAAELSDTDARWGRYTWHVDRYPPIQ